MAAIAPCARCGKPAIISEGLINGKNPDGSWHVTHRDCSPKYVPRRERKKDLQ